MQINLNLGDWYLKIKNLSFYNEISISRLELQEIALTVIL